MYRTIKEPSEGIYRESGSRFLAFAYPIAAESQVKEIIRKLEAANKGAVHFCFAYILGEQSQTQKSSDDGEPSGSAGKPILNQILSLRLTNILIVVVRYYGGVKLGIPGLIRAYKTAAADAIANAEMVEKQPTAILEVAFPYEFQGEILRTLKMFKANVLTIDNHERITLKFEVEKQHQDKLAALLLSEQHRTGIEWPETA